MPLNKHWNSFFIKGLFVLLIENKFYFFFFFFLSLFSYKTKTKQKKNQQQHSKPLTYAIALEKLGAKVVHSYVGQEPSGRNFNELVLDYNSKYIILLSPPYSSYILYLN